VKRGGDFDATREVRGTRDDDNLPVLKSNQGKEKGVKNETAEGKNAKKKRGRVKEPETKKGSKRKIYG